MSSDQLVFLDIETTGLDPDRHEPWEVALISGDDRRLWHLPVDLGRADPIALRIGGFHERYGREDDTGREITALNFFAAGFADWTRGKHLVGAIVSFDEERLRKLLRSNGACPEWHYHIIDVEAMAIGWLSANKTWRTNQGELPFELPWKSEELTRELGIDPDQFAKHTAMGDAEWAKAIFEKVTSTTE